MKKQELEELRRLEEELMATEYAEEDFPDEIDLLEDSWHDIAGIPYDAYNADQPDVDLAEYSEAASQGKQKRSVMPIVLTVVLLGVVVFYAMKFLGVM